MESGSFRKGCSKRGTRCTRFRFIWGVGGRGGGRISSLGPVSPAELSYPPPTPRSSCSELGKEARGLNDKTKPRCPTKKKLKHPFTKLEKHRGRRGGSENPWLRFGLTCVWAEALGSPLLGSHCEGTGETQEGAGPARREIRHELIKAEARAPPRGLIPAKRCPPARKSLLAVLEAETGAGVGGKKPSRTWVLRFRTSGLCAHR